LGIGRGFKQLGRFEDGVAAMLRAIDANPRMSVFLYNRACYHASAGQTGQAVECLAEALAMRPEWQEMAKKDSDFASIQRDKGFVALVGDREPARQMQAELKRGLTLAERGRCEEAIVVLGSMTERHPHLVDAWVAIGRCLRRLNRPGDAAAAMAQGLESSRNHPRLMYNLACYQSLAGQGTVALRTLLKALSLHPKYAEAAKEDRDLDSIRSDPRFAVIVTRANE
jgi:tetratricopeptide (TPR) repeat protein